MAERGQCEVVRRLDSRGTVRGPVPQLALLKQGFKRLQPVGHLEVTLLLRDGQQPKEVKVPVAYVTRLKFRPPGVGQADQETIAPCPGQPRLADGERVAEAQLAAPVVIG